MALDTLLSIQENERRLLAKCLNQLFDETFILRRSDAEAYYFIRKYQDVVRNYLDLMDWDLIHDDLHQIFQAVNRHGANRRSLNRLESELLLILCISYLEQEAELQLAELPSLTFGELYQKYRALLGETGRLRKTYVYAALRTFQRYHLIAPPEGRSLRSQDPDQPFVLLPTLRLVIDAERLEDAGALLEKYRADQEEDHEGDENDDAIDGEEGVSA